MDVALLTEHYQKTFELTLQTWEKRNQTFLILLGVVGVATLLTINVDQQPLIVDLIVKILNIKDSEHIKNLRSSFPYGMVQSILLMIVLYLTLILYHRTATINRFYKYLAHMELEIREHLSLEPDSKSFTRESSFYDFHKPFLSRFVAASYIGMLGVLLVSFLAFRLYSDFSEGNPGTGVVDILLSIPTLAYFFAYAGTSYEIVDGS